MIQLWEYGGSLRKQIYNRKKLIPLENDFGLGIDALASSHCSSANAMYYSFTVLYWSVFYMPQHNRDILPWTYASKIMN